jgi:predicted transcriptional regulator
MARRERDVTEAELAILQLLWDEGSATVRQLIDRLYAPGGHSARATVRKLLERLEDKGCITRDTAGPLQIIAAAVRREDLMEQRIRTVADRFCGGSIASLFTKLIEAQKVPARERRALRDYLNGLEDIRASDKEPKAR